MKKIITYSFLLISFFSFSQSNESELVKKNENSKSGNYKDVFSSFLQLASENFDPKTKSLNFNSTLFTIKSKADPELLKDENIRKAGFSRNFQFNVKLDLDNNYKYKGFTGGFTYAIVNGRDKSLAVLTDSKYGDLHEKFKKMLTKIRTELVKEMSSISDDTERQKATDALDEEIENIKNANEPTNSSIYNNIIVKYNKSNSIIEGYSDNDIKTLVAHIKKLKDSEYEKIDAKPLWTISADGTANTDCKFNKASLGTIFLVGNNKAWNEIDLRAKLTYTDTLKLEHLPRTGFNAKAGMNFKIGKDSNQKSYFEVKVYGEYNAIFNNLIADEKKSNFLANSDIRIRLTDDLWIPITIKYDTDKANFLGFLNVTYNFNPITNKKTNTP